MRSCVCVYNVHTYTRVCVFITCAWMYMRRHIHCTWRQIFLTSALISWFRWSMVPPSDLIFFKVNSCWEIVLISWLKVFILNKTNNQLWLLYVAFCEVCVEDIYILFVLDGGKLFGPAPFVDWVPRSLPLFIVWSRIGISGTEGGGRIAIFLQLHGSFLLLSMDCYLSAKSPVTGPLTAFKHLCCDLNVWHFSCLSSWHAKCSSRSMWPPLLEYNYIQWGAVTLESHQWQ